jgi:hypothetical protein
MMDREDFRDVAIVLTSLTVAIAVVWFIVILP